MTNTTDPQIVEQNWAGFKDRLAGRENTDQMRDPVSPLAKAYRDGWAVVEHVIRTPDMTHDAETVKLLDKAFAAASEDEIQTWEAAAAASNVSPREFARAAMNLEILQFTGRAA